MNKEKLISFLNYLGYNSPEFTQAVMECQFDMTITILDMVANRDNKPRKVIEEMYEKYDLLTRTFKN